MLAVLLGIIMPSGIQEEENTTTNVDIIEIKSYTLY